MKYKVQLMHKNKFNGLQGTIEAKDEATIRKLAKEQYPEFTIDKIEEVKE